MNFRHIFSSQHKNGRVPGWCGTLLSFVPAFLIMAMIFSFSSQNADSSSSESLMVTRQFLCALRDVFHLSWSQAELSRYIEQSEFFVRKTAHFTEYALLGISWFLPVQAHAGKKLSLRACALISLGISAAYAASDEFHQSFIPGRSPQVRDVLIDSTGALTGILLVILALHLLQRWKRQRKPSQQK